MAVAVPSQFPQLEPVAEAVPDMPELDKVTVEHTESAHGDMESISVRHTLYVPAPGKETVTVSLVYDKEGDAPPENVQ